MTREQFASLRKYLKGRFPDTDFELHSDPYNDLKAVVRCPNQSYENMISEAKDDWEHDQFRRRQIRHCLYNIASKREQIVQLEEEIEQLDKLLLPDIEETDKEVK